MSAAEDGENEVPEVDLSTLAGYGLDANLDLYEVRQWSAHGRATVINNGLLPGAEHRRRPRKELDIRRRIEGNQCIACLRAPP